MTDFIVRIEGPALSQEEQARIQSALQKVVLTETLTFKTAAKANELAYSVYTPVRWHGIVLAPHGVNPSYSLATDLKVTATPAK
jgi:predicted dienelactone hydrolase